MDRDQTSKEDDMFKEPDPQVQSLSVVGKVLKKMADSTFLFTLTGSRFFHRLGINYQVEPSDTDHDFFTLWTPESETFLHQLGFQAIYDECHPSLRHSYGSRDSKLVMQYTTRVTEYDIEYPVIDVSLCKSVRWLRAKENTQTDIDDSGLFLPRSPVTKSYAKTIWTLLIESEYERLN